jgi:hypothetical protein
MQGTPKIPPDMSKLKEEIWLLVVGNEVLNQESLFIRKRENFPKKEFLFLKTYLDLNNHFKEIQLLKDTKQQ